MELHCIYHIPEAWRYDTKLLDMNMNPSWNANDLISINTEQQSKSLDIKIPLMLKSLKIRSNVALAYSLYWSLRPGSRWNQLINTPKGCGSRDKTFLKTSLYFLHLFSIRVLICKISSIVLPVDRRALCSLVCIEGQSLLF